MFVSEGGGQSRDLVSCGLQASRGLGHGSVEGRHGQRPAGLACEFPVGRDFLLRRGQLSELRAHAHVLGLGLGQGTPLGEGTGGLASRCRGRLGDA